MISEYISRGPWSAACDSGAYLGGGCVCVWVGGRIVYVRGRGDGGGGTCLVRDDASSQHQPLGLGGARFRLLPFNDSEEWG
jgi:hypothetical protein